MTSRMCKHRVYRNPFGDVVLNVWRSPDQFPDTILMSLEEARQIGKSLQNIGMGLACPPECCGEAMTAKALTVDGNRRDMWLCRRCGCYRNRRM